MIKDHVTASGTPQSSLPLLPVPRAPLVLGICPRCSGVAFVRLRDMARFCPEDGLFYEGTAKEVLSPAWIA